MTRLSRILKDYRDAGALHALVGIHAAIDDQVFLTKSGDLVLSMAVEGIDFGLSAGISEPPQIH